MLKIPVKQRFKTAQQIDDSIFEDYSKFLEQLGFTNNYIKTSILYVKMYLNNQPVYNANEKYIQIFDRYLQLMKEADSNSEYLANVKKFKEYLIQNGFSRHTTSNYMLILRDYLLFGKKQSRTDHVLKLFNSMNNNNGNTTGNSNRKEMLELIGKMESILSELTNVISELKQRLKGVDSNGR